MCCSTAICSFVAAASQQLEYARVCARVGGSEQGQLGSRRGFRSDKEAIVFKTHVLLFKRIFSRWWKCLKYNKQFLTCPSINVFQRLVSFVVI